jgi:hypothetical protein
VAVILVVVALLVWCSPVGRSLPLDSGGDVFLHTGWSSQLLNGETTPSAAITGEIPNFYPWLGHSLMAMIARSLPEGRTYHALSPLQILQVVGVVLGLFALGRALTGKTLTGATTALLGGMTGGIGFIALRGLDLVTDPRAQDALRYFGDLFHRRSYNIAFSQLAPPWPRDVAYTLIVGYLLLAVLGLKSRNKALLAASGVTLGMTGLVGAEAFYVGLVAALALSLVPTGMSRWSVAAYMLIPTLVVAGLWFGPQIATLTRFEYRDITQQAAVILPAGAVLGAWGITTPLAIWGLFRQIPRARSDSGIQVVLVWTLVSGTAVLVGSFLPALFGDALDSIGRSHRYWPLLHFGLALFAALAMTEMLERLWRRRWLAATVVTMIIASALISPTVASLALPRVRPEPPELSRALRGEESFMNLLAPRPGGRCVVAIPMRPDLDTISWSYTGYRFVNHTTLNAHGVNPARIRWDGIYQSTTPVAVRKRDNLILTRGRTDTKTWRDTVAEYGVDIVVVPYEAVGSDVFEGYRPAYPDDVPYALFRLSDCGT